MSRRLCPICKTPFGPDDSPALPFCSIRCKNIDLGRWMDEVYSVPHEPPEDEELDESGLQP